MSTEGDSPKRAFIERSVQHMHTFTEREAFIGTVTYHCICGAALVRKFPAHMRELTSVKQRKVRDQVINNPLNHTEEE